MKRDRQNAIVQIINTHNIETQEEVLEKLKEEGYDTTQATVSRDIRRLGITKISFGDGRNKYCVSSEFISQEKESYRQVLSSGLVTIDYSENIIVVKTVSGMAMAVGAAIDAIDINGIMGCIAGDDTLFLAIKHKNQADDIVAQIRRAAEK